MWKIALGFVVFAGLALWVISMGGDSLDMSGEKHDVPVHAAPSSLPARPPASAPAAQQSAQPSASSVLSSSAASAAK